jgi:predicted transcriptional regulator
LNGHFLGSFVINSVEQSNECYFWNSWILFGFVNVENFWVLTEVLN